jgi:hypothetical protein
MPEAMAMATTGNGRSHSALDAALDIFRMRQYFSVVTAAAPCASTPSGQPPDAVAAQS